MSTQSIQEAVFNSIAAAVFSDPSSSKNLTAEKTKTCFQCHQCGRQFQSEKNLNQHMWCLSEEHVNAAAEKENQPPEINQVTNQVRQFPFKKNRNYVSPPLYRGPSRYALNQFFERFYPSKVPS